MNNLPVVKVGLVAVSRDCFPIELSRKRRKAVSGACAKLQLPVVEIDTVIENEKDMLIALEELRKEGVNALVLYLGNFGPEGPASMLAEKFKGPVMYVAAAEETGKDLINGRGDAYCGLLNLSYNTGLRRLRPYLPSYPVGTADEIAVMIKEFVSVSRIVNGVRNLKILAFGPRPHDFITCHAPLQPLYNLGVEIMENSELDLYDIVQSEKNDPEIERIKHEMAQELGTGNTYPDLLDKLARFENALDKFMHANLGASSYAAFANKCWPAFEKYFGHVPCYVNSRFAARGIPVACEVDIYGALSEYMAMCATGLPATILDINNTVPIDMYNECKAEIGDYSPTDLWMGFHCGNTSTACLVDPVMKYQLIMHRLMEPGKDPDITRGTLEGQIKSGPITMFRLQSTSDATARVYTAQGSILSVKPKSFGGIGVFAIREMGRFYRHVLVEKRFPHHSAIAFAHAGRQLFAACKMMGIEEVFYNQPAGTYYPTENPF